MGEPSSAGAVQETAAENGPATAVTPVGASGTLVGVTLVDGSEAGPVPSALVAVTVKVTGVPLVSPLTVQVVSPPSGVVQVWPVELVTV